MLCVVVMVTASAQKFYSIESVNRLSATQFEVRAGAQYLGISPYLYDRMKNNKDAYVLVTYVGTEASAITVARRDAVTYVVCTVDSVGIDNAGNPMVFLSNGKVYNTSNKEWLKVQPGQKVAGCVVDGETKVITRRWHTVPRETAITTAFPLSPAPTAPVVQLTAENKVVTSSGQLGNSQQLGGQPGNGQQPGGQPGNGQQLGGQPGNGQQLGGQPGNGQQPGGNPGNGQQLGGQPGNSQQTPTPPARGSVRIVRSSK